MILLFRDLSPRLRWLAGFGIVFILVQWWFLPWIPADFGEKWYWSLNPARFFPAWFRVAFPLALLFVPFQSVAQTISYSRMWNGIPPTLKATLMIAIAGSGFWVFRIGTLELGDAKLILDHFTSLNTYASVREPLESILHTEFSRILFYGWGVHPEISFQIHSCLIGVLTLGLCCWGVFWAKDDLREYRSWIGLIFLIGPIHLFFGYIEWYTQLAAGILVFEVFAIIHWKTGRGLWVALLGLIFATCSHLVGFALVPAAIVLILMTRPSGRCWVESLVFLAVLFGCVGLTLWWIKSSIEFEASVEATSNLFATLLPMMREDNPSNPPGSWTYAWLSLNHLSDLVNEIVLCGLFPLLVLSGSLGRGRSRRIPSGREMNVFFGLQFLACGTFLLIWNPWLGFPGDWDLFSFFAWPLLAFALFVLAHLKDENIRTGILWVAGYPALSIILAWVIHYHQPDWITLQEVRARISGNTPELFLKQANEARNEKRWDLAFERSEEALRIAPHRRAEVFSVFNAGTLQEMSQDWGDEKSLIPLAVDFEIMAASPMTRFLVMDSWGRLFFQEGGYFNDWSIHGLPNIPKNRAVDFEIVPWRRAAVILDENGDLYEVPVSSWVNPNPSTPRETIFQETSPDREPKFLGNFYSDFAGDPLGRGQRAVDFALDYWNERMVVLDTTGNLVGDGTGTEFDVTLRAALTRCDVEMNYNGEFAFVTDHFGTVTSWPGMGSSVQVIHEIGWPAITDLELTRGGNDLYLLDGQGGVSPFSRLEKALIDPSTMSHFYPTGEPLESSPYVQEPIRYFIDLEILPNEKTYYKMTTNFRIHRSQQMK